MKKILFVLSYALLGASLVTGCVAVMGNTEQARKTTIGQELIDLKKAHDAGVLTDTEYEAQKEKLLGERRR